MACGAVKAQVNSGNGRIRSSNCISSVRFAPLRELNGRTERLEVLFQCGVIAPDHVGRLLGNRLDAVAAEDGCPLRVEAVRATGDRARFIDETGAGRGVEQRTDDGPGGSRGVLDAA